MADAFAGYSGGIAGPASDWAAVTPSDTTDLAFVTRAVYVGGSGDISLRSQSGAVVTFVGVPAGTLLPVRAARVRATGTTAINLVALW